MVAPGKGESLRDSRGWGTPQCTPELPEGQVTSAPTAGGKVESVAREVGRGHLVNCVWCFRFCFLLLLFPVNSRQPLKGSRQGVWPGQVWGVGYLTQSLGHGGKRGKASHWSLKDTTKTASWWKGGLFHGSWSRQATRGTCHTDTLTCRSWGLILGPLFVLLP